MGENKGHSHIFKITDNTHHNGKPKEYPCIAKPENRDACHCYHECPELRDIRVVMGEFSELDKAVYPGDKLGYHYSRNRDPEGLNYRPMDAPHTKDYSSEQKDIRVTVQFAPKIARCVKTARNRAVNHIRDKSSYKGYDKP